MNRTVNKMNRTVNKMNKSLNKNVDVKYVFKLFMVLIILSLFVRYLCKPNTELYSASEGFKKSVADPYKNNVRYPFVVKNNYKNYCHDGKKRGFCGDKRFRQNWCHEVCDKARNDADEGVGEGVATQQPMTDQRLYMLQAQAAREQGGQNSVTQSMAVPEPPQSMAVPMQSSRVPQSVRRNVVRPRQNDYELQRETGFTVSNKINKYRDMDMKGCIQKCEEDPNCNSMNIRRDGMCFIRNIKPTKDNTKHNSNVAIMCKDKCPDPVKPWWMFSSRWEEIRNKRDRKKVFFIWDKEHQKYRRSDRNK